MNKGNYEAYTWKGSNQDFKNYLWGLEVEALLCFLNYDLLYVQIFRTWIISLIKKFKE